MRFTKAARRLRPVVAGIGAAGLGATVAAVGGGSVASAEPVSTTLDYTCSFPLIGEQAISVEINSDMPSEIAVGEATGAFEIDATATVPDAARAGLAAVGAATLGGSVDADAHLGAPNLDLPLTVGMDIPDTEIPSETGPFDVVATGSTPSLTFEEEQQGTATVTVGDLLMTLTPLNADGNETGLGTFESACTLDEGQDGVLHTFDITGGGSTTTTAPSTTTTTAPSTTTTAPTTTTTMPDDLEFSFDLAGESYINAAGGSVPLSGSIDASFNLATGNYTADLALDPTSGTFPILGFLSTNVDIEFEQVGQTTGSLVDGTLTSSSEMNINIPNIAAYGLLPLGGGPDCGTSEPTQIELSSPEGEAFNPAEGGTLEGTYTLPPLEGCGWLNGVISAFTAGPDNTIELNLTPSAS